MDVSPSFLSQVIVVLWLEFPVICETFEGYLPLVHLSRSEGCCCCKKGKRPFSRCSCLDQEGDDAARNENVRKLIYPFWDS